MRVRAVTRLGILLVALSGCGSSATSHRGDDLSVPSTDLAEPSDASGSVLDLQPAANDQGAADLPDATTDSATPPDFATPPDLLEGPPQITTLSIVGYGGSTLIAFGAGPLTVQITGENLDTLTTVDAGPLNAVLVAGGSATARTLTLNVGHAVAASASSGLKAGAYDLTVTSPTGSATLTGAFTVTPIKVTTTGDDTNGRATPDAPLRTVTKALGRAAGRDEVDVAAGTYNEAGGEVWPTRSGVAPPAGNVAVGVSIVGAGSGTTKLQSSTTGAVAFAVVDPTPAATPLTMATSLQGFALSSFTNGVYMSVGGGFSITDVAVDHAKDGFDVGDLYATSAMDTVTATICSGAGFYFHDSRGAAATDITNGSSTANLTGILAKGLSKVSYKGDSSSNGQNTAGSYDWSLASGATVLDGAVFTVVGSVNANGCVGIYDGSTGAIEVATPVGASTTTVSTNGAKCSGTGVPAPKTGGMFAASSGQITLIKALFSANKSYGLMTYLGGKPPVIVANCQFNSNGIGLGIQYTTTSAECNGSGGAPQISVTNSSFVNNSIYNAEMQGYVCVPDSTGATPLVVFTGNTLAESASIETGGGVNLGIGLSDPAAQASAVNACNTTLDSTTLTNPFKATTDSLPLYQIASGEVYCGTP
jgi:Protein of unknown function (DUF1565)